MGPRGSPMIVMTSYWEGELTTQTFASSRPEAISAETHAIASPAAFSHSCYHINDRLSVQPFRSNSTHELTASTFLPIAKNG